MPNNNRDAAVANTLADTANSNNSAMSTSFDVSSLMPAGSVTGGGVGVERPAQSSGAGVASGAAARWSTFTPGEVIHIDWSRYNNATAIRDFVETPDGSSSALGGGLLQSTFRVMGNIGEDKEVDAAMGTDPNSSKIAASFADLLQNQQSSSFLAPHGELIHIDWTQNNNASAIRDFKDSDVTRDHRGILRSTFAVLGDAQQSAAASATDTNYDDFGGGVLSSHLQSAGLGGSSYLSSIKGDARNMCGGRLEGFERCLALNGGDTDRCADAWENFVTCQQEMQARSSFY